jgi:YihY family inner membrane protein
VSGDSPSPQGALARVDRLQRGQPVLGFPYAVFKRYYEDHGGWLGSLISYYGFFSLYPLLVVFTTVATWMLRDRPKALQRLLQAVWSKVPFATPEITTEVQDKVTDLSNEGWAVAAVSLIVALWGGVGVVRVLQDTVNSIYGVPRYRRPTFVLKVARGLAIIGLLGLGIVGTAVVTGITLGFELHIAAAAGAAIGNIALSTLIAIAVYKLVIGRTISAREVLPGAVITGIGTWALTLVGGLYVQRVIARMTGVFGPFASTVGLLAYVSLSVQVFVIATEVNVVKARRLWPRSLTGSLGSADRRAIALSMQREALAAPDESTP